MPQCVLLGVPPFKVVEQFAECGWRSLEHRQGDFVFQNTETDILDVVATRSNMTSD
jgi:hypothetical protein